MASIQENNLSLKSLNAKIWKVHNSLLDYIYSFNFHKRFETYDSLSRQVQERFDFFFSRLRLLKIGVIISLVISLITNLILIFYAYNC